MENTFLRLVSYKGEWLDGINHPCTEDDKYEVAKELLHNNAKACCCYYFDGSHNFYSYPINRISVDEENLNDIDYQEWKLNY